MLKKLVTDLINKNYTYNKERLTSILLPTVGFKLSKNKPDFTSSRIGGYPPILEENFPTLNKNPLTFLGQICLPEIKDYNDILPKVGYIFFYIYSGNLGYRYPDKKGEFKVIFKESMRDFNQTEIEIDKILTIKECEISFFEYYTFPSSQGNLYITDEEFEIIDDIESETIFKFNQSFETEHQLLGHPRAMQGTVKFWWAVKYLEIDQKDFYTDDEVKIINDEGDKFVLLLQLNFGDSCMEFDYFGDAIAYFGIHKSDLEKRKFENTILVMQNT